MSSGDWSKNGFVSMCLLVSRKCMAYPEETSIDALAQCFPQFKHVYWPSNQMKSLQFLTDCIYLAMSIYLQLIYLFMDAKDVQLAVGKMHYIAIYKAVLICPSHPDVIFEGFSLVFRVWLWGFVCIHLQGN